MSRVTKTQRQPSMAQLIEDVQNGKLTGKELVEQINLLSKQEEAGPRDLSASRSIDRQIRKLRALNGSPRKASIDRFIESFRLPASDLEKRRRS